MRTAVRLCTDRESHNTGGCQLDCNHLNSGGIALFVRSKEMCAHATCTMVFVDDLVSSV
jgi:hypothetical protein